MLYQIAKIFRTLLLVCVALIVLAPAVLYILLSTDWAREKMRETACDELTKLLGTKVEMAAVDYSPLNTITIDDVAVADDNDSTALTVGRIDARFEMWDFIVNKKIIIDYVEISDLCLRLYRDSISSPLNIDRIVKRLKKDDPDKEPTRFKLRLNDVSLKDCALSYDVTSEAETPGRFNPAHIKITNINLDAFAPIVSDTTNRVWLRALSLDEASGFSIKQLRAQALVSPTRLALRDFLLRLPSSSLAFNDIDLDTGGFDNLAKIGMEIPVDLSLSGNSHIYLPDLKAFVPLLGDIDLDLGMEADISGVLSDLDIRLLRISDSDHMLYTDIKGLIKNLPDMETVTTDGLTFEIRANRQIASLIARLAPDTNKGIAANALLNMGDTRLTGNADGSAGNLRLNASLSSHLASAAVAGNCVRSHKPGHYDVNLDVDVDSLLLGALLDKPEFNHASASVSLAGNLSAKSFAGDVSASVRRFDYKGHSYRDAELKATLNHDNLDAMAMLPDRFADFAIDIRARRDNGFYQGDAHLLIHNLQPDSLNLGKTLGGIGLRGDIGLNAAGSGPEFFKSTLHISDADLTRADGNSLHISSLRLEADNSPESGHLWLTSDFLDGNINGRFRFKTLGKAFGKMLANIVPTIATADYSEYEVADSTDCSRFNFNFSLIKPQQLANFFRLGVQPINKADIFGDFDESKLRASLNIDVPWILQGNKVVRNSVLNVALNGTTSTGNLYLTTHMPTKKGDMDVVATISAANSHLRSDILWEIERTIPINGRIRFDTDLYRNEAKAICANVTFDDSQINFGEDTWQIRPSSIIYDGGLITVNNLVMSTLKESISINGTAGKLDTHLLTVTLSDIQLINIFETLEINNALISGNATGTIYGRGLLGPAPDIRCDRLHVKDIGYNYCTLGNADVKLKLGDGGKLFEFDADVTDGARKSYIDGSIYIPKEELLINIAADRVKVGFMKPFMAAFTSDVSGYASGHARLFGTFADLDLEGDIMADSVKMKVDFTNTWYTATDSVHLRPGIIKLDNITLHDEEGQTALLNGWVGHTCFHNATFDFNITDARNFLVYDVPEKLSPIWYGRIYGNGRASIKGKPGIVDIGVNMTTAPNSVFTFVLSDQEEAEEYSFINFRDATPRTKPDPIINNAIEPKEVRDAEQNAHQTIVEDPTDYNMDFTMSVNQGAQLIIVMDPVGGDRIRARGNGAMRMRYGSRDNDLRLYGTYTLEQGNYNFTLQDIIIKDFIIKEGSSITFNGDPYAAQLNIQAYNQVNANLSDLDKSFLQDKEIKRTQVPVRALLDVTGDMRQPDISFDLELPTLSTDVYRKVKSIISTEDMMNRQIIYLLALNRFYTPEYMASTTKGDELFSVASSTIASQLSSMLGKLSENWSIAPNLRSDRGDFSDLEVDVALSSSLLNNRLLFNGNFGYRDKSLNTNQFIGDFDIEYLLNRSGSWRLKAYNRYNDQNYYLRTAQTTQGVGIVYRRDFDSLLSFTRYLKKHKTDSIAPALPDTIIMNDTLTIKTPIPDTNITNPINNE